MKHAGKIISFSIILVAVTILASIMNFGEARAIDAESYIQLSYFIQGKDGQLIEHFAARPLVPALASLFNNFFDINTSFGIVNTIFLCLTSIFLFLLFSRLFNNIKLGFLAALFFPLSFPIILLGSQVLTDAAGYFFLILAIYFIEFHLSKLNMKNFLLSGLIVALALLARDSSIIILIYLALTILINRHKYMKRKFSLIYKFFLTFIIAILPFSIWKYITNVKSYPIIERISSTTDKIFTLRYFFSAIIRSILSFHILWLPAIYGLFIDNDKNRRQYYYKILLTVLPLMIIAYLTLAQNYNYDLRHTFTLFPLIFPLAAYALTSIDSRLKTRNIITISFIILYVIISFIGASLVPDTPIRNSLIDINFLETFFK